MSEEQLYQLGEEDKQTDNSNDEEFNYIVQQEYLGNDILDLLESRYM